MTNRSPWLLFSALSLSCCSNDTGNGLEKWSKYQDPMTMQGLQTRPIDVRYGGNGIYVNGGRMDASSALKLLGQSRDLSPMPSIVVSIESRSYSSAVPFLRAISNQGLCDLTKCQYRLVKE